jgi:hypothetical protein
MAGAVNQILLSKMRMGIVTHADMQGRVVDRPHLLACALPPFKSAPHLSVAALIVHCQYLDELAARSMSKVDGEMLQAEVVGRSSFDAYAMRRY